MPRAKTSIWCKPIRGTHRGHSASGFYGRSMRRKVGTIMARKVVVSKDVKVSRVHVMSFDPYSLLVFDSVRTIYGDFDEAKLAEQYDAVYLETLASYNEVYAVDADTFRSISFVINADESRRNLITRTVVSNIWTVFKFDPSKGDVTRAEYVFDGRCSEKDVVKSIRGAKFAQITGKVEELRGCTLDTFMEYAKPHTR